MAFSNRRSPARPCLPALALLLSLLPCSGPSWSQPVARDFPGIPSDCRPVYAASGDGIELYRAPDVESETIIIPYQPGWELPYRREDAFIRVQRSGLFSVLREVPLNACKGSFKQGGAQLRIGEPVELLYQRDDGLSQVLVRGVQCRLEIQEDFNIVRRPRVQYWLKVLYGDGSGAGWLLNDGSQTRIARMEC